MDFDFAREKEQSRAFISYWLRRIFLDDWLMKLFALVITFALWLGVTGLQEPITRPLSKVRLNTLISSEFVITNTPVDEIELVIEGDKRKVNPLRGEDLVVTIDLTDEKEGERTIQLTPQNIEVELPSGVKVVQIRPDKIAIHLDKVEENDVPVRAETTGKLAEGFEIYGTPRVIPEKVRVRGPRSFVRSLNFVSTEKIDVSDRRSDFTVQQVPISLSNSKLSLVDSATVAVTFRVGRQRITVRFTVPFETENKKGRASVTLYGSDKLLDGLSADDIRIVEDPKDGTLRAVLPEALRGQIEIRHTDFKE